jgi:REP element-mobilizing transposase RayT
VDDRHRTPGNQLVPVDKHRVAFETRQLMNEPIRLSPGDRDVVDAAIRDHAAYRAWVIHALKVRTNHVHVVVTCADEPEKPLREFKAWATRRLRERGLLGERVRVWTRHGSTRYLFDGDAVCAAVRYVVEGQ